MMSPELTVANSKSWQHLKYKTNDVLQDSHRELSGILKIPEHEAQSLVNAVLDSYHFKKTARPKMNRDVFSLVVHLTQPYRIPSMLTRMDYALDILSNEPNIGSVLDYGGGGGKDSIILSRAGYQLLYCDFLDALTPHIARRFGLRNLNIAIEDVRDLQPVRYDCVVCLDVLEHVYDFEFVVADVISHLRAAGILLCWPSFFDDWTGDHKAKNCAYRAFFTTLMESVGMCPLENRVNGLMVFRREMKVSASPTEERDVIRAALYRMSQRISLRNCISAAIRLPFRLMKARLVSDRSRRQHLQEESLGEVIDNADVWRLSHHRLAFQLESIAEDESRRT
jgi:SAM-dependent methyltransferase